ncbi:MAG TPA: hotdog fold domain-containing protein [Gemmatimonadaceae bacterium]|nr:hotdog fold domain-containing protein [Gemmatimonadaceae bacterium]
MQDVSAQIRSLWTRLSTKPGGKRLFSWTLGRMVPYTGSIHPRVLELRAGYARVEMRDRRAVRNHLRSIHAIALANLAEVASGLAVIYGFPPNTRGILIGLTVEYVKKARGTLVAECACGQLDVGRPVELEVDVVVRDAAGDVVVRARPRWRIGPAT